MISATTETVRSGCPEALPRRTVRTAGLRISCAESTRSCHRRQKFMVNENDLDHRKGILGVITHRLTDEKRRRLMLTCTSSRLRRCRPATLRRAWLISSSISIPSAASTAFSMPIRKFFADGGYVRC